MIINLTPHVISLPNKEPILPSGNIVRAIELVVDSEPIDSYPTTHQEWGSIEDLPEFTEGTYYIVSLPIWNLLPDRKDLLLAGQQIRDESGKIIGCKSLVRR